MKQVVRSSMIKSLQEYANEHVANLQAYIDGDCLKEVVERGEQPSVNVLSFEAETMEKLNHNGSEYNWYQVSDYKARIELECYGVVFDLRFLNGCEIIATVKLVNGSTRKVKLGEYGAGECFTWITNKTARMLRGEDSPILYFDDLETFWHVIKNDSFFVNSITFYMFNGCEYQD